MGLSPSQMRRNDWLAKTTASQTLFVSVYGTDVGVTAHNHAGQRKRINYDAALAICNTPLKWTICCYAICRDNNEREYLKAMAIELSEPVKQDAINQALSHAHYDWMKAEVNMNHLLTLAWIATTGPEPSQEVAAKALAGLGAWSDFDRVKTLPEGGYLTNPKSKVSEDGE